jgi:sacsin
VQLLRGLIIDHVSEQNEIPKAVSPFDPLKRDLRTLQLWPSAQSSVKVFISAENSLIAGEHGLLVPWMKQYSKFIDPKVANGTYCKKCLQLLGIQKVSAESLVNDYILPLPAMSTDANWSSYRQLIVALAPLSNLFSLRSNLSQTRVAVDGNRSLCRVDSLFDHEDDVFKSAFRGQEYAKFLHQEVQAFREFWLDLGLRHRGSGLWKPLDYLQCLQSLSQRQLSWGSVSDDKLAEDTRVVLSPLTTLNSSTRNFGTHWSAISRERVFLSQSDFGSEPEHRRPIMSTIATNHPLSTLSTVVSHKHVALCWSQTPFALHEPTTEVFAAIQGGNPPLEMVWKHLEHLADTSQHLRREQMAGFLQDLHSTYTYLQDHTTQCKSAFNSRLNKELWLNIVSSPGEQAILMEVQSSWTEIGDLNLSILQDAGSVKAIKPNLMPYEKLLRALGCESVIWPTVTLPDSHEGHSTMAGVRSLRSKKKFLFDITFRSEGRDIEAHRLILAAISEKLTAQWNGDWPIEDLIVFNKDTDWDGFISYHALSTIINYAYEEKIDWSEMEASPSDDEGTRNDKLNLLLDLHKGADFWLITGLKSEVEGKMKAAFKLCVNIQNVKEIRKDAKYVNAKSFEKMCAEFMEKNHAVVERASGRTAK